MKIRSLLLGSAAALVTVPFAQAADAVVVEPEPVEYVRVCDAYGAGFFFIPGTETCIDFGGYVRTYYSSVHVTDNAGTEIQYADWATRARLQIDTRNETDWGTLRAYMRFDTDVRGGAGAATLDRAVIQLAGFRAGVSDLYWITNHGYAGVNLAGIVADPGFMTVEDGWYNGTDTESTFFDYTWAQDGLSITGGVESVAGINRATNNGGLHNYYVGVNYSADWGGAAFTAAYDSDAVGNVATDIGGWAYKVSVDLDLSEFVPGGRLHAMYMTDDDHATNYVANTALADAEETWQISAQMDLSDEFVLAAQYSDSEEENGNSAWNAGVGLNWYPAAAPGFSVYAAYHFGEADAVTGAAAAAYTASNAAFNNTGVEWDGFTIRVRRDF